MRSRHLKQSYLRVDRARERIAELEALIEGAGQFEEQDPFVDLDPEGEVFPPLPDLLPPLHRVAVMAGEVFDYLRAALDHLVSALSRLDSGAFQIGAKFPIDDGPEEFGRHRNTDLRGVSDKHAAKIARLQPYNGVEWPRVLRDLTTRDGNDAIPIFAAGPGYEVRLDGAYPVSGAEGVSILGEVNVKATGPFQVAFADGSPVVETLKKLEAEVGLVIDSFDPSFER